MARPGVVRVCGAAGGYLDLLGYPFCRGRILRCVERDEGQYDDERDVFWVSGAAFCCRAEVFRELGGFDASFFAHMEEIDLCWRMRIAGRRVRIVPRSAVYHLGGGTLKAQSPAKVYFNHRNNLAMLFKCAPAPQRLLTAAVRPPLDALAALSYPAQGAGGTSRRGPRVVVVPAASSRTRPGPAPDSGDTPGIRRHLYLSGFDRAALPRGAPDLRADDVRLRRAAGRLRRTRVQLRFDGRTAYFPCLFLHFRINCLYLSQNNSVANALRLSAAGLRTTFGRRFDIGYDRFPGTVGYVFRIYFYYLFPKFQNL